MTAMLRHPRTAWRQLTPAGRLALYIRGSLYLALWLIPVMATVETISAPAETRLTIVVLAIQTVITTALLARGIDFAVTEGEQLPRVLLAASIALALATVGVAWRLGEVDEADRALLIACALMVLLTAISPLLHRWWAPAVVAVAAAVVLIRTQVVWAAFLTVSVAIAVVGTVRLSLWMLRVVEELAAARATATALSVAQERLRFARDLHDVMGRTLSAISVKSQLAASLVQRDGDQTSREQAGQEMTEISDIAHGALREMRTLVRGYREVNLDAELSGARSLLQSAGIVVEVVGHADLMDGSLRDGAAWFVRESITNVLRHSAADRCEITIERRKISVWNNGISVARNGSDADSGVGLTGLTERLETLGGVLDIHATDTEFTLTAEFPR